MQMLEPLQTYDDLRYDREAVKYQVVLTGSISFIYHIIIKEQLQTVKALIRMLTSIRSVGY